MPWVLGFLGLVFCGQSIFVIWKNVNQHQVQIPEQTSTPLWYQGGSLQNANLRAWLQSKDYDDQRATAFLFLQELHQEQKIKLYIRSIHDYKPWAAALTKCISAYAKNSQTKEQPAAEAALFCVTEKNLKDFR